MSFHFWWFNNFTKAEQAYALRTSGVFNKHFGEEVKNTHRGAKTKACLEFSFGLQKCGSNDCNRWIAFLTIDIKKKSKCFKI